MRVYVKEWTDETCAIARCDMKNKWYIKIINLICKLENVYKGGEQISSHGIKYHFQNWNVCFYIYASFTIKAFSSR